MRGSVTSLKGEDPRAEVVLSSGAEGDLEGDSELGGGIRATIDLADPHGWRRIVVHRWAEVDRSVLGAMVGDRVVRRLDELHAAAEKGDEAGKPESVEPDLKQAKVWLRLAALDVLDDRVQLPLNQSLIDAERAVTRLRAAESLAPGPSQQRLVGEALQTARLAAKGVVAYLHDLRPSPHLPAALFAALKDLDHQYRQLRDRIGSHLPDERPAAGEPRDRELESIHSAWSELAASPLDDSSAAHDVVPADPDPPAGDATSAVDVRKVPARVVAVAADPGGAEIIVRPNANRGSVHVHVPAFGDQQSRTGLPRLQVRVLDGKGRRRGEGILFRNSGGATAAYLGDVPVEGDASADLRADVFADRSATPPSDSEDDLRRARRATLFLREWRWLAAEARLKMLGDGVGARLSVLARQLTPAPAEAWAERLAFRGGPTPEALRALADAGADGLEDLLTRPEGPAVPSVLRQWAKATAPLGPGELGPGEPLVAELAAVHRAAVPPSEGSPGEPSTEPSRR